MNENEQNDWINGGQPEAKAQSEAPEPVPLETPPQTDPAAPVPPAQEGAPPDRQTPEQGAQQTPPPYFPPPFGNQPYGWNQWNGYPPPPRRRKGKSAVAVLVLAVLACFLITVGMVAVFMQDIELPADDPSPSSPMNPGDDDAEEPGDDTPGADLPSQPYEGEEVSLGQVGRPHNQSEEYDEYGRYTAQGVAKYVRQSVVGILNYVDESRYQAYSQGSGIIMSADGYIITNAHVLEDAQGVVVVLDDEREYEAKIIGADYKTDLAVIKIDAVGLTPAVFGNSDEVVLGESVIAIGNPAGLAGTITQGIVSGVNREIKTDQAGYLMNCIQTDAAINPGNSGGALVNLYGQVIGINSSKYIATGYEGIGFAIAINEVKPIVEEIILNGYVTGRVRIGIVFYEISQAAAEYSDVMAGLYVMEIDPDCPVALSGLQLYDTIVEVDGTPVESLDDVSNILKQKSPGDSIRAKVYRVEHEDGMGAPPEGGQYLEIDIEVIADTTAIE